MGTPLALVVVAGVEVLQNLFQIHPNTVIRKKWALEMVAASAVLVPAAIPQAVRRHWIYPATPREK
jgi:hypothetical protein